MSELVINQSVWSNTGLPVEDSFTLENPGGFVVNVEATAEEPLRLPRCACNAGAAAEGNDPATGYGLGLFGRATGKPEQEEMDLEQKRRLGLLPFPGAPAKSFG